LGTGTGFLRAAQGISRKTSIRAPKAHRSREDKEESSASIASSRWVVVSDGPGLVRTLVEHVLPAFRGFDGCLVVRK
jgi:hypothetical protein